MPLVITDYAPYSGAVKKPGDYTIGEAIKIMVDQSPDYHDGQLEGLVHKIEALTKITAKLADAARPHLSDEDIRGIVGYPLMIKGDEE